MPEEEDNCSTLTEHNRKSLQHFSFKLHVNFDKWIGSDSMATETVAKVLSAPGVMKF